MDNSLKGFYSEMEKGEQSVFWQTMIDRIGKFEARVLAALVSDPPDKIPELQGKARAIREILGYPQAIKEAIVKKGQLDNPAPER